MLHHQLAWYVGGPLLGLCVVAVRLLLGERLGVTGGYTDVVETVGRRRSLAIGWQGWFLVGLVLGGTLFALIAGGPDFHGYGWLTAHLDGPVVAAFLVIAGVLIGYGAKMAGGCTSGNGLAGTSMLSPASLAATAVFFSTAIVVSFLIKALI
jgi:uncharacterized membrane protein YedE/YeeE